MLLLCSLHAEVSAASFGVILALLDLLLNLMVHEGSLVVLLNLLDVLLESDEDLLVVLGAYLEVDVAMDHLGIYRICHIDCVVRPHLFALN